MTFGAGFEDTFNDTLVEKLKFLKHLTGGERRYFSSPFTFSDVLNNINLKTGREVAL